MAHWSCKYKICPYNYCIYKRCSGAVAKADVFPGANRSIAQVPFSGEISHEPYD